MTDIDIIDHHTIIRKTVGYEMLNEVDIFDMPKVMQFLKIMYNYNRMKRASKQDNSPFSSIGDWEQQIIKKLLSDRSYAHGFHEGAPLYKMEGMYYVLNMELDQIIRVLDKLD